MQMVFRSSCVALAAAVVLAACNAPTQQKYDLYEIRSKGSTIDYDSYYSAPRKGSSCSTDSINESPSCGGI